MKVQDESTSVSPSGHHYRHYKAIPDHYDLCLVHVQIMLMPWLAGFTPISWKEILLVCWKRIMGI
eukprot:6714705-Ditylum_brightwellii.AAC.1